MSEPIFKENRGGMNPNKARALYVHIPFCLKKCRYCDFYSLANRPEQIETYLAAAVAELDMKQHLLDTPLNSTFIGGGTPTSIGHEPLRRLLEAIRPLISTQTEVTVEANPTSMDAEMAQMLLEENVNRVNLGVQSFQAQELELLGRTHSAAEARAAVANLQNAGIANTGIDLIYGIPGQCLKTWRDSLKEALDLGIRHLSCYGLSFEPGTQLQQLLRKGSVKQLDESLQREMYYQAIEIASRGGLEHYEISNFASQTSQCRHNLTYWRNEPYVGIGPSAASYVGGIRSTARADLQEYLTAIQADRPAESSCEQLTGRAEMAETIMLALRMIQGLDSQAFTSRFGLDPLEAFPVSIQRYASQGTLIITPSHIRLGRDALFVSDAILADILAEA